MTGARQRQTPTATPRERKLRDHLLPQRVLQSYLRLGVDLRRQWRSRHGKSASKTRGVLLLQTDLVIARVTGRGLRRAWQHAIESLRANAARSNLRRKERIGHSMRFGPGRRRIVSDHLRLPSIVKLAS